MLALLARRLALGILTLWMVSVLVFAGTEMLPGDVATAVLGQSATPETVQAIRGALQLDRPAPLRYAHWLAAFLRGDLGQSLASGRPVVTLIADRLGNTLFLAAITAIIAVPISIGLGLAAAIAPNGRFDRALNLGALIGISLPEFFTAYAAVFVFAVVLGWLPAIARPPRDAGIWVELRALALPILTLTGAMLAHMMRMTRTAVIALLGEPYIEMAVLKGLPRRYIVLRHALPNAIGPIAAVVALNLAYLVVGGIIVEVVFAYPGMGQLMVDAVASRDIPLVQACAVMFASAYVILNLAADLVSTIANPRLRRPR
jgi:peptide/nickel transport system permease protein